MRSRIGSLSRGRRSAAAGKIEALADTFTASLSRRERSLGPLVATRAARALLPALNVGLALIVVPGLAQPFSTPKLWWLLACALVAAGLSLLSPEPRTIAPAARQASWLSLGWLGSVLLSALAAGAADPAALGRDAAAAVLVIALLRFRPDPSTTLRAIAFAGALVAASVLLQWAGVDLFSAHATGRLRLHGTLGNPDFAAAWLGAALPLTVCEAIASGKAHHDSRRRLLLASASLQVGALAAIGSLATVISLVAAALVLGFGSRKKILPAWIAIGVLAALGAVQREPGRALQGRLYLHRVALPHLIEAPLLGQGPGAIRLLWPAWEEARKRTAAEAPFVAAQDHVHDDWLERALDLGLPSALCLAALAALSIGCAIRLGRAQSGPAALRRLAAGAALAGLCARAFVDFPLARPAELGLFATLIALALAPPEEPCPSPERP